MKSLLAVVASLSLLLCSCERDAAPTAAAEAWEPPTVFPQPDDFVDAPQDERFLLFITTDDEPARVFANGAPIGDIPLTLTLEELREHFDPTYDPLVGSFDRMREWTKASPGDSHEHFNDLEAPELFVAHHCRHESASSILLVRDEGRGGHAHEVVAGGLHLEFRDRDRAPLRATRWNATSVKEPDGTRRYAHVYVTVGRP